MSPHCGVFVGLPRVWPRGEATGIHPGGLGDLWGRDSLLHRRRLRAEGLPFPSLSAPPPRDSRVQQTSPASVCRGHRVRDRLPDSTPAPRRLLLSTGPCAHSCELGMAAPGWKALWVVSELCQGRAQRGADTGVLSRLSPCRRLHQSPQLAALPLRGRTLSVAGWVTLKPQADTLTP